MKKTALITGASKRVGEAITRHLAGKGWNILLHYNNSGASALKLEKELGHLFEGQKFETLQANLSNPEDVGKFIPMIVSIFGEFELLVNNASVFNPGFLAQTSSELFDSQINVNLKAPFILMRDFYKYCKKGNIINLVDTRITTNKSDFAAYSLSKKGLWELTKMAAWEFAPAIRVNAIAPGVTLAPEDKDEDYLNSLAANIPMKKPGGVQPILKSIDYILGNDHLTGQLLFADGGENLGRKNS